VPVGDILVRDTTRHVKHNDGTLSLDVIPVTETTKLFLSGGIPYIEFDGSTVGVEHQGMNFDTQRGDVLLFEFTRQVTFDKGGLSDTTITDKDQFEFGSVFRLYDIMCVRVCAREREREK
jgi:hypothetical protein